MYITLSALCAQAHLECEITVISEEGQHSLSLIIQFCTVTPSEQT